MKGIFTDKREKEGEIFLQKVTTLWLGQARVRCPINSPTHGVAKVHTRWPVPNVFTGSLLGKRVRSRAAGTVTSEMAALHMLAYLLVPPYQT